MAEITAALVKELRDRTGAGMMDCKKALVESDGDMDKAVDFLRERGLAAAQKKATRIAAEGVVLPYYDAQAKKGVVVEVNSETDFVAKNESFVKLAHDFAERALNFDSKEDFLASDYNGISVAEKLIEQTGVIGEKIEIGAFEKLAGDFVGSYIHAGNKIATLTSLSANVEGAEDAAKAVSMQVAAMNPIALDETAVSQETIDKELEIERELLTKEGKPANIIDNILKGKMQKFYKENTLVHQAFIKDGGMSVADFVKSVNGDLKVTGFKRVALS